MCGIAAVVAGDGAPPAGLVERMVAELRHRGPDETGAVTVGRCALGHARLSIIDPAGGRQPMADDIGRFHLTFNGVIFNFRELRRELEALGRRFHTSSDTEVLLRAFEQWGEEAPLHLTGQFAFAVWDAQRQRLFAARDRMGEKPLHWVRLPGGGLAVASELKALVRTGVVRPTLDPATVEAYLGLLYVPPGRTIYSDVESLAPAHALVFEDGVVRNWRYWTPRFAQHDVGRDEAVARIAELVAAAVERQTVADVPIGAFLSGGLDSATVVAEMSRVATGPVRTFSVGFGDLIDELPYARAVATRYATEHHEIGMEIAVGELLETMAGVYDEPFADSSNIPTYLVSQFARREVKVVLSGDGGDELFGGYEWYRPLRESVEADGRSAAGVRGQELLLRTLAKAYPSLRGRHAAALRGTGFAAAARAQPDLWNRHLGFSTGVLRDRHALWADHFPGSALPALVDAFRPGPEIQGLDRAVSFDVAAYLPGDILVKVDRASMAHGLETRAPFLDTDLVEFVLGLPTTLRLDAARPKSLLRDACGALWPEEIRDRPKQGFGAPIAAWLARPDVSSLLQRVLAPDAPLVHLLPGLPAARASLDPQELWSALSLGLWLERQAGWFAFPW